VTGPLGISRVVCVRFAQQPAVCHRLPLHASLLSVLGGAIIIALICKPHLVAHAHSPWNLARMASRAKSFAALGPFSALAAQPLAPQSHALNTSPRNPRIGWPRHADRVKGGGVAQVLDVFLVAGPCSPPLALICWVRTIATNWTRERSTLALLSGWCRWALVASYFGP